MKTSRTSGTKIARSSFLAALFICAFEARSFDAWPVDALVKVLPDFTKPAAPAEKVRVAMARGETEAGQVAFRGAAEAEVSASITPPRSESGAVLENVKAQFLNYHSVPRAQWPTGAVTEFLKHPDEFPIIVPDAFCPDPAVMLKPDQTRSLWIIAETKPDTPAGLYRGAVTLEAGDKKAEIPVEVRVFEAVVPAKRSLKIYNWVFLTSAERGLYNPLGSPDWGERDWALLDQIAANMTAHRQNMFTVPVIHNVLHGPEVHSVRVVWKKGDGHNVSLMKRMLQGITAKGGKNLLSGRDPLTDTGLRNCIAGLNGIANQLTDENEDDAAIALLAACAADIDKARADAKHEMDMARIKEVLPVVERFGILAHGVMGRRAPGEEDDDRSVFERECEFDFTRFDRAAEIFLKHDPEGIVVGGWLGLFGTYGDEIVPGEKHRFLRTPEVPVFDEKGEQVDLLPRMQSGDKAYIALLRALMPAVAKHVKEKGWADNFMMSLCDETFPNRSLARVMLAKEIREVAPEIRFVDAIRDAAGAVGGVDFWFPLPSHLEAYLDFFHERQKAGEQVGYYTCVTPGGYNMNRFADFPLIKTRLLHWHNFRFGTTGFLHWGYNARIPAADVAEIYGNGDFNLIYKDAAGNLVSSIRQAAQRDGIEDYELLKVVEAKDALAAGRLCAAIVTDCREYTRDATRFRDVRELLLAAAGPGDIDPALKQKIMALEPDHFILLKDMPRDSEIDDTGWELVYSCDKFKPENLGFTPEDKGADWIVTSGEWTVENGTLTKVDRSDGHVFFAKGAGRDQKLEFTAWSDLPYPNDLSAMLCGELKKEVKKVKGVDTEVWTGGYGGAFLFQFGGEGNAFSKFMVKGVEFRVMPKVIEPGKKYKIVCRREGRRITFIIDGEVLLDAESKDTLDGEGNVHPGFYFFENGRISDVKIYTRK